MTQTIRILKMNRLEAKEEAPLKALVDVSINDILLLSGLRVLKLKHNDTLIVETPKGYLNIISRELNATVHKAVLDAYKMRGSK